jgi:hypothetical protein
MTTRLDEKSVYYPFDAFHIRLTLEASAHHAIPVDEEGEWQPEHATVVRGEPFIAHG